MLKLCACGWLAIYLNPLAKIVFVILHQACRGIIVADHLHVNVRHGQPLVKSLFKWMVCCSDFTILA